MGKMKVTTKKVEALNEREIVLLSEACKYSILSTHDSANGFRYLRLGGSGAIKLRFNEHTLPRLVRKGLVEYVQGSYRATEAGRNHPAVRQADTSLVHKNHCFQGDFEAGCKYGDDDCPAAPVPKP
jgi:hypothetical protein